MGCRNKVELSVWQICFLISLSIMCVIVAVIGWFRTIDPPSYGKLSSNHSNKINHVISHVDINRHLLSFLDDIGSPPKLNNPQAYVEWTFLQMNDVYELIPLGGGKKGGLARVATIRKLLLEENPNTITFLAGDVVSPSALGMKKNDTLKFVLL
jgi:2',3'-cyclic-nucleotide 2'-phosphodiesterase (5'-nucleotidase family)